MVQLLCIIIHFFTSEAYMVQDFSKKIDNKLSSKLNYSITTPTNFSKEEKLPLIVFLHGAGERGDDINKVKVYCVPKLFGNNPDLERVVTLSPQCPHNYTWYDFKWDVIELIEDIVKEYNIDSDRVTLCGISMGGFGTWDLIMRHTDRFAAAVPICGGADINRLANAAQIHWRIYHGDADKVVPVTFSRTAYTALKQAGAKVIYREFPGCTHNSWNPAFNDLDLFPWLFNQKK